MRVRTDINANQLRRLSVIQAKSVTMTAIQMLSEVRNDATIPFDTGNLQNESTYVDDSKATRGKVTIVSDTPYARRVYYHPEINFGRSKNANADAFWWDEYLTGSKKKRARELFIKFMIRNLGSSGGGGTP